MGRRVRAGALALVAAFGVVAGIAVTAAPVAAAEQPTVSIGDVSVAEGDTKARTAVLAVTLSEPSTSAVTLSYTIAGVSAVGGSATTANVDFNDKGATARTLTFNPAAGSGLTPVVKYVAVTIYPDTVDENDETFTVTLSGTPAGYVLGDAVGTGTIVDDDPGSGLRVSVGDATISEGDTGRRNVQLRVVLSQPATTQVSVTYTIVPVTATGGYRAGSNPPAGTDIADFSGQPRTLVFRPALATGLSPVHKTVAVSVYPDLTVEGDETFQVVLANPTGGITIADSTGTGTITDDDGTPPPSTAGTLWA